MYLPVCVFEHNEKYAYGPNTDTDTHTGCTDAISEKYAAGTVLKKNFKNEKYFWKMFRLYSILILILITKLLVT